ncbi:MAG: hypothetical protein FWF36_01195, partial [Propionibacteriaceae bacterium]|nr:hypothetical protein [Propionibacteriaceae bacterium]
GRTEGMELGRAEGIEQGMERGTREAQLASARVALKMGFTHTDVAEITGLDLATINQLAQE